MYALNLYSKVYTSITSFIITVVLRFISFIKIMFVFHYCTPIHIHLHTYSDIHRNNNEKHKWIKRKIKIFKASLSLVNINY